MQELIKKIEERKNKFCLISKIEYDIKSDYGKGYRDGSKNELEWVLSELQKESDLMQEMLEVLNHRLEIDDSCNICLHIGKGFCSTCRIYNEKILIQKVKQEMELK